MPNGIVVQAESRQTLSSWQALRYLQTDRTADSGALRAPSSVLADYEADLYSRSDQVARLSVENLTIFFPVQLSPPVWSISSALIAQQADTTSALDFRACEPAWRRP